MGYLYLLSSLICIGDVRGIILIVLFFVAWYISSAVVCFHESKILCFTLLRIGPCYFVEVVLYLSKLFVLLCDHLVVLAKILECSFSVQGCNWL
jgi:hypothetical protein